MVRYHRKAENDSNRCLHMQVRLWPPEGRSLQNKIQSLNSSNRDLESRSLQTEMNHFLIYSEGGCSFQWPAHDGADTKDIPDNEDDLKKIAKQLLSHDILKGEFDVQCYKFSISIIARVYTRREIIPLIPHPVSTPFLLVWYVFKNVFGWRLDSFGAPLLIERPVDYK